VAFKRRHQQETEPSVPTDSFSDVAFLLIIFFILTTSIQQMTGFNTDFPSAESGKPTAEKKATTVAVADGNLRYDGKSITMPELRQRLLDLRLHDRQGEDKVVMVESSGKVDYQTYYLVLAAITKAGGIVAVEREETSK